MSLLSRPFFNAFGFCGKPGLGPAAEVLAFASPKESTQRKGTPGVCDPGCAGAPCDARVRREPRKLAALKHARLLIRPPLRFSAQTQGWGRPKTEATKDKGTR